MNTSDTQPTGRPNARMRQTVGDMVRSMAVVLAVVAVVVLLAWRPEPEAVKVVDAQPVLALAGAEAGFPVLVPTGLPESWRVTSARWEPTAESESVPVLHLGYVTPADAYAQVSQSTARTARYLDEQTGGGEATGQETVGDRAWERFEADGRRSLVLADGSTMTVVSGSAGWDELTALAASLQPASSTGT